MIPKDGMIMGAFDQAARFAAQADPEAVVRRVLASSGLTLPFRSSLDTRPIPFPGGPDRTADLVAALDAAASDQPWLMILEFQSQHDPDKLDVTLEEAGILRGHARHGDDRKGKYKVLTTLVYLQGRCPEEVLDMTVPGGFGTRHSPLIWNVGEDQAFVTLEAVASGQMSWGMLFWVPLMAGSREETVINRWKEVVTQVVSERRTRGNLAGIALVFTDLVGWRAEWKRGLEGFEMTESQVVNEWIDQGEVKGTIKTSRRVLLKILNTRFPGALTEDVQQLIQHQDSKEVLENWLDTALEI
jgi:hypothetical protein